MAGVFDVLAEDHVKVKQMLAELEAGTNGGGPSVAARKKLAEELVIDESKHEALEEMYFWPAVRDKVSGGDKLADTAIAQEEEGKQILDKIDKLEADDPEFDKLVSTFIKDGREHIEFEETQVWPALKAALSKEESEQLGAKIADGKKTAPTRPHPHTPAAPGVLKTAGPAAAAADRVRDKASGRGD
jgi:hemerythrin-like domain-containing protein